MCVLIIINDTVITVTVVLQCNSYSATELLLNILF